MGHDGGGSSFFVFRRVTCPNMHTKQLIELALFNPLLTNISKILIFWAELLFIFLDMFLESFSKSVFK